MSSSADDLQTQLAAWVAALNETLEIDADLDTTLVLDLARDAAHNVVRPAAPISTYLLGYAVAKHGADSAQVRALTERAQELAVNWTPPAL